MLELGNSPAIQCLGVCTLAAEAQVQSRVGDLRSQKPLGLSKRKKKILEWSVAPKERLGHEQGDYHPPFFSSLPDLGACFFFFFFFSGGRHFSVLRRTRGSEQIPSSPSPAAARKVQERPYSATVWPNAQNQVTAGESWLKKKFPDSPYCKDFKFTLLNGPGPQASWTQTRPQTDLKTESRGSIWATLGVSWWPPITSHLLHDDPGSPATGGERGFPWSLLLENAHICHLFSERDLAP